jgi:glycosyltransferase involved in cell wall biosynthesis
MDLSIVVPVYNEVENVERLALEIVSSLKPLNLSSEILFVNDGSVDGTTEKLNELSKKIPNFKAIHLRKNFGQTSAMVAGFDTAQGDILISMDGDGQNDPADIPRLIEKLKEGFDIVSGWRRKRQDKFFSRRLPSIIANKIISWATQIKLHDYGCSLKAFRKEVIDNIHLYGEMHRFIPAVASWMGIRLAEIEVNHRARQFGTSKYGIARTFRVVLDLITIKFLLSFSTKPIRVFGFWGLTTFFIGALGFFWVVFQKFFLAIPAQRPLLTVSLMMILSGLHFLCFGLLAELQTRMYHESTNKPIYAIKNINGMGS